MTEYSPHQHFLLFQKDIKDELGKHIDQKWFRLSLDAALAVTAFQGASEAEVNGIRRFLSNLSIMSEPQIPELSYPSPRLASYDPTTEEAALTEHLKKQQ